jgi:hypothetical protein
VTIHGRPKDELIGEDVRIVRRNRRLAWSAGIGLAALAVAASIIAYVATVQRDAARSRESAALATSQLAVDPHQSLLLAIQGVTIDWTAEAYALMTSGYRMAEHDFKAQFPNFPTSTEDPPKWEFPAVEESMKDPAKSGNLLKLLKVGSQRAFKIWRLSTPLKIIAWISGIAALILLLGACWKWSSTAVITLGAIGTTVALMIAGAIFGKTVMRVVRYRDTLSEIAIGVGMSLVGWILARIHLHIFDRLYLRKGRIKT